MRQLIVAAVTLTVTVISAHGVRWLDHQMPRVWFTAFTIAVVTGCFVIACQMDKAAERDRRLADERGLARLPRQDPEVFPPSRG